MFTASPLSNDDHTLLLLQRLHFLSAHEIVWLSKIIRKAAHFLTYAIMAICLRNAMYPHPWTYPAAWLLATIYGAGDEIHQIYVFDRTPLFTDVIIDSLGAGIGLLIIYWRQRKLK
jgi:VanZ family protein